MNDSLLHALPRLLWSELDALSKDPSREPDLRLAAWEEMQAREVEADRDRLAMALRDEDDLLVLGMVALLAVAVLGVLVYDAVTLL